MAGLAGVRVAATSLEAAHAVGQGRPVHWFAEATGLLVDRADISGRLPTENGLEAQRPIRLRGAPAAVRRRSVRPIHARIAAARTTAAAGTAAAPRAAAARRTARAAAARRTARAAAARRAARA